MRTNGGDKPRVVLLHNFMTPYRVPLFAELARRFDFEVWILGDVRAIREWPGEVPQDVFRWRLLPHVSIPTGSRDYRILLNLTLPHMLRRDLLGKSGRACDALICCGWDTPAAFRSARWARRVGMPFVLWSGSTAGEPNWRRRLSRPMVTKLVRGASSWIAYGTRAKDYLVSLGARGEHVFPAFNTVDLRPFERAAAMTESERDTFQAGHGISTRHMILYCGQLIERKGLSDLIPAFARVIARGVDATLWIIGSGRGEAKYRGQAQRAGIAGRVRFEGFVAREDLPSYYAAADLLALPSRQEVWGLVINESLACGTPVLTTGAVGASPDLLKDGVNGYVVPPRDPERLAGAMLRHFADDGARRAMRVAARNSIAPFTIARAADAFERAVRVAVERR